MTLRAATPDDAAAIALIHQLAAFVPPVHTPEEILAFSRDRLLVENAAWVAEVAGDVVGYIAFNDEWVVHLFVHPDHQGQGHGPALLAHAMADGRARRLWTFQKNARARRFYEARGWMAIEETDGAGNEEKEPDVLYEWRG